ncbi:MAG: ABC transporter permease, partial [Acidimicrobiales bacterium]
MSRSDQNDTSGSKLRLVDVLRVGAAGPRARKMRTVLSALGVSIGIAALVGVLGLSESSKSALLDEISALGTNLLTVEPGSGFGGGDAALPETALDAIDRIPTVTSAAAVWEVNEPVYRTEYIDEGLTGGIGVVATSTNLVETLNGTVVEGNFPTEGNSAYPVAAVGAVAAERLGIRNLDQPTFVLVGDHYVEV